jgi:WD40 repeat protein
VALKGHQGPVLCVAWPLLELGKMNTLLSGGADGQVKVWDVDPTSTTFGTELAGVKAHDKPVTGVGFASIKERGAKGVIKGQVVSTSSDGTAKVWPLEANSFGKEPSVVVTFGSAVSCLVLIGDSGWAATGHEDGKPRFWDLKTGKSLFEKGATSIGHTAPITAIAFMAGLVPGGEGRRLVLLTASADQSIKAWDASGSELYTVRGHAGVVTALAAVIEESYVFVSGSADQTVKLWGPTTWSHPSKLTLAERFTMPGTTSRVRAVAYGSSGRYLAAAGEDGTVYLWRGPAPGKKGR